MMIKMNKKAALARLQKIEDRIEKIQNKSVYDATGDEIIFPEVEEGDQYTEGDKVELENDKNPTFERVMPDGSTIVVKEGVLEKIIPAEEEETVKAQKVFRCNNTSHLIEIYSDNPKEPFKVGNTVNVNGNANVSMGRFRYVGILLTVNRGKISSVKSIPSSRKVYKKPNH